MKIGLRVHDVKRQTCKELNDALIHYGFDSVQLVLKKAVKEIDFTKTPLDSENTKYVSSQFRDVEVKMLGAYFNPVHSNKEKVKKDIEYFKSCLDYASVFGCEFVGSETGSYNDEPWIYHPKNQTEEGYLESKSVLEPLVRYAKKTKAKVALEGAWGHVMYKPSVLKRLYDEINSDSLKIIVDIYNYLYIGNYENAFDIFKECLDLFGQNIEIFHIKDFIVEGDKLKQTTIGKGIMPLDKMLPLIKKYCPNATLIFEGSVEADLEFSLNFVLENLNKGDNNEIR